jgi:2,4-dienoyl-CoA reductase-like NADH-dependent reductase (Old Yellow Enzyme family)
MTETLLATPLTLPCGAVLPNRLAKAAMSEQLAARDGSPTAALRRLYAVWGRSGAGLLLTGNTMINRGGMTEPGNVILDDDRALDAVRSWTSAAKEGGAAVWMQINHPGKVAVTPLNVRPIAPSARRSGVPGYNLRKPRALSEAEIRNLIEQFARTAELAVLGGFDGVQIHAAHGYLLSQFLSPLSNRRDDEWGGDTHRRQRMLLSTVASVREKVGPGVPVSVKLNARDFIHGGLGSDEAFEVALALQEAGVDLLEISGGGYEEPAMTGFARGQERTREGYFLDFAESVRAASDLRLMLTGGMRSPAFMESVVASGVVDVVGIGRPMTFVPDYPARILAGENVALPARPPQLGHRLIDGYVELAYHNAQLHRIAGGRTPQRHPGLNTVIGSVGRLTKGAIRQATIPR